MDTMNNSAVVSSNNTPWKKALVSSDHHGIISSSRSSESGSLTGSPTSVLSQSAIKAWNALSEDNDWLAGAGASLGLTAGAAAPIGSPLQLPESSSESECEVESLADTSSVSTDDLNPASISSDVPKALSPLIKTPPPSFNGRRSEQDDDKSKGLLPIPSPLLAMQMPVPCTPTEKTKSTIKSIPKSISTLTPSRREDKEPMKSVVLSSVKKAGTGVFIPARLADKSGRGGHVTRALLPARLVKTLGLEIDPETSEIKAKSPLPGSEKSSEEAKGLFYGSLYDYHIEMNAQMRKVAPSCAEDTGRREVASKLPDSLFC